MEKTKTTFNTSVLKVVYWVVLVFWISNFFINKNSQGRKLSAKKIPTCGNSALPYTTFFDIFLEARQKSWRI